MGGPPSASHTAVSKYDLLLNFSGALSCSYFDLVPFVSIITSKDIYGASYQQHVASMSV